MPDDQLAFNWAEDAPTPPQLAPLPRIAPLANRLKNLAERGVYLGTSSWKYPGWIGQVYDPVRYQHRGKLAPRQFERECLAEYATVFPTVGGDFSFYQFPSPATWRQVFDQLPVGFRFSLKVPEDITARHWPNLPRYGQRAGTDNPHFMDAALLHDQLLGPLESYRDKLGVIMFEFGTLHDRPTSPARNRPADQPADQPLNQASWFAAALDRLLSRLPLDRFKFAVEVRNREFLCEGSDYLACLKSHGVAHCLNSWTRMPSLAEQLRIPGIFTAGHVAARLLLRPGRAYQQAVDMFSPYERVQEPYPDGRSALRELIERCLANQRTLFAFVNNRFEGNAPETIDAATRDLD
ncbi:MAG: DUF72 domain-containing protein [Phycisphaerae bacterium]|nr:DUF72 domain-containing protein [Phycisphaerae bacterium]